MSSHPGYVVTKVHHNNEALNVSFHGFENPASYRRNMTYFASWDIIDQVRQAVFFTLCQIGAQVYRLPDLQPHPHIMGRLEDGGR